MKNITISFKKARRGSAIIIAVMVSIVALFVISTIMTQSATSSTQVSDAIKGKTAYYAAEGGVEDVKNFFNLNMSAMGTSLSLLPIAKSATPESLSNGSKYWVSNLSYANSNNDAVVDIIGNYKGAYRKIRIRLKTDVPSAFNDYGLLTNGILTIHGSKILRMSIHGNGGLSLSGGNTMENNAVATQSNNSSVSAPHSQFNPIGGYVPNVYVPIIPISDLRTKAKSNNILLDISDASLTTKINDAPAGSNIYITTTNKLNKNNATLNGNLNKKMIFFDGDVNVNIEGASNLTNGTVVTAGKLNINGSIDIVSSHPDQIDVVFAAGDDVTLNGSRDFKCLFWSNGVFTQNGASLAGRVIANEAIFLNGSFVLTQSGALAVDSAFEKIIDISSFQLIPVG
jgi:hypothetical protein